MRFDSSPESSNEDGDREMVVVLHDTAPPVKRVKRKQLDLPEPPSLLIQPTPSWSSAVLPSFTG